MILNQILSNNLRELENKKHTFPIAELRRMALEQFPPLDFASALKGEGKVSKFAASASDNFRGGSRFLATRQG